MAGRRQALQALGVPLPPIHYQRRAVQQRAELDRLNEELADMADLHAQAERALAPGRRPRPAARPQSTRVTTTRVFPGVPTNDEMREIIRQVLEEIQ